MRYCEYRPGPLWPAVVSFLMDSLAHCRSQFPDAQLPWANVLFFRLVCIPFFGVSWKIIPGHCFSFKVECISGASSTFVKWDSLEHFRFIMGRLNLLWPEAGCCLLTYWGLLEVLEPNTFLGGFCRSWSHHHWPKCGSDNTHRYFYVCHLHKWSSKRR